MNTLTLPIEILFEILDYMTYFDILNFSQACYWYLDVVNSYINKIILGKETSLLEQQNNQAMRNCLILHPHYATLQLVRNVNLTLLSRCSSHRKRCHCRLNQVMEIELLEGSGLVTVLFKKSKKFVVGTLEENSNERLWYKLNDQPPHYLGEGVCDNKHWTFVERLVQSDRGRILWHFKDTYTLGAHIAGNKVKTLMELWKQNRPPNWINREFRGTKNATTTRRVFLKRRTNRHGIRKRSSPDPDGDESGDEEKQDPILLPNRRE